MKITDEVRRARRVGAPLVAVQTADQPRTADDIRKTVTAEEAPVIYWDIVRGFTPVSEPGRAWVNAITQDVDPATYTNLVEALSKAQTLPAGGWIVAFNMARLMDEPQPAQAVMNLRDTYKSTERTLVMLGTDFRLPAEIQQDILVLDEALPDAEEIAGILDKLFQENSIDVPADTRDRAIDALRGLAAFPVEQAAALSLRRKDKDAPVTCELADLWERKRRMIAQTKGLTMEPGAETFEDIGGVEQAKNFFRKYFAGRRRPKIIVFIDEIEKSMAGASSGGLGDTSGTSQDQLGVLLSEMQDRGYSGALKVGPPGACKTMIARAVAATFSVPCVRLDLGAAKGSLVGQSEQQIRGALKAINAMAGERGAFFIATCNRLDSLPPELRRRFRAGVWFYDLPDAEERKFIAALQKRKYESLPDECEIAAFFAGRDGWSGANIADCCEMAYAMDLPLAEAAEFIVPAATQDPQGLARLRAMANGRFLSAAKRGRYAAPAGTDELAGPGPVMVSAVAVPSRKLDVMPDDFRRDVKGN